jgi:hypothetical protein
VEVVNLNRRRLVNLSGVCTKGAHNVSWDAMGWHSGVYYYFIVAEKQTVTGKLVVFR